MKTTAFVNVFIRILPYVAMMLVITGSCMLMLRNRQMPAEAMLSPEEKDLFAGDRRMSQEAEARLKTISPAFAVEFAASRRWVQESWGAALQRRERNNAQSLTIGIAACMSGSILLLCIIQFRHEGAMELDAEKHEKLAAAQLAARTHAGTPPDPAPAAVLTEA